jgi:hypothetical protein
MIRFACAELSVCACFACTGPRIRLELRVIDDDPGSIRLKTRLDANLGGSPCDVRNFDDFSLSATARLHNPDPSTSPLFASRRLGVAGLRIMNLRAI